MKNHITGINCRAQSLASSEHSSSKSKLKGANENRIGWISRMQNRSDSLTQGSMVEYLCGHNLECKHCVGPQRPEVIIDIMLNQPSLTQKMGKIRDFHTKLCLLVMS